MPYSIIYLATNATANGTLNSVTYDGSNERCDVYFGGTFNGASVELQASPLNDGSSNGFVDVSGGEAIINNSVKSLSIGKDTRLQVIISNAGASTSLTIYIRYFKE